MGPVWSMSGVVNVLFTRGHSRNLGNLGTRFRHFFGAKSGKILNNTNFGSKIQKNTQNPKKILRKSGKYYWEKYEKSRKILIFRKILRKFRKILVRPKKEKKKRPSLNFG